jgi:hypothetical protein
MRVLEDINPLLCLPQFSVKAPKRIMLPKQTASLIKVMVEVGSILSVFVKG